MFVFVIYLMVLISCPVRCGICAAGHLAVIITKFVLICSIPYGFDFLTG